MSIEKIRDIWGDFETVKDFFHGALLLIFYAQKVIQQLIKRKCELCTYNIITQNQYAFSISFSSLFAQKVSSPSPCLGGFLWEEVPGDMISAIFHFVISSYYTMAQSMA